jgi:hypothetical protein
MNDTLTLPFREPPASDDCVEGLKQIQQRPSSSMLIPMDRAQDDAQALSVSEARSEHEGPSSFNYAGVPEFADQLRETAVRVRRRMGVCLIETGRDLLCWRHRLKKGQFHRWLEDECKLEVRTAQLAMMVAGYADHLGEQERENFSRLPAAVQYQLAAPSVPDAVRAQVLETSAAGRPIKVATVKELVRAAKRKTDSPASSLDNDTRTNRGTENEDRPAARAKAASAKDDVIFSAPEPHRLPTLSDSPNAPEIQTPARAILQSKLNAATDDPRRQAIIKEIFVLLNKMSATDRVNLISSLSKLADITSRKLAECLQ